MINELMVDIETSGDKPGCKVLSLGIDALKEMHSRLKESQYGTQA